MARMDATLTRTTPEDGGVVVGEERRGETPVCVSRIAPGADQYEFDRRDDAIAQGVARAARRQVRVSVTDKGDDFVRLDDFRVLASALTKRGA